MFKGIDWQAEGMNENTKPKVPSWLNMLYERYEHNPSHRLPAEGYPETKVLAGGEILNEDQFVSAISWCCAALYSFGWGDREHQFLKVRDFYQLSSFNLE
jgi:hypothetical protein